MNIFAIGDIHGCLNELVSLQKKIFSYPKFEKENDLIVYIGDYIDRGPNSKEVIDHILKLQRENINSIFLMGNHEQVMIDFLFNDINNLRYWINLGADKTFRSYDIEIADFIKDGFEDHNIVKLRKFFLEKISKEHINFFNDLKLSYTIDNYFFVHAGIDPNKTLEEQTKEDFLWSRSREFYDKSFKFNKIIIHGHTPEKEIVNLPYRINVDIGCFFSGKLASVLLNKDNKKRIFLYS